LHLLGIVRLIPRLKRIKYERLYLPERGTADLYPNLAGTFARPIRWEMVEQQYDEMIKSTVALQRGTATAEAILKRYNSYSVTHPTYKALAEISKAEKTIYLCNYLASRETQREVQEGLNVVENWNATNDEQPGAIGGGHAIAAVAAELSHARQHDPDRAHLGAREIMGSDECRRPPRADPPLFHGHSNPYGQFALNLTRPSLLAAT
jgi:hypothetical protein